MSTKKEQEKRRESLRPHPKRDQILDVMRSYGKPISPTQVARITGQSIGSTAYHIRTLLAAGIVELADEGRVRGAVEHFYDVVAGTGATPASDPVNQLLAVCGALTIPDPRGGYPQPTLVDSSARAELEHLIDELAPRVQAVAAAANDRARRQAA